MACSSAHRDQMSTEGEVVASYSPTLLGENRKELLPLRCVSRAKKLGIDLGLRALVWLSYMS